MKLLSALMILAFASHAQAAATLKVPLVLTGNVEDIPVAQINLKLKAAGKTELPTTFEISSTDKYNDLVKKLNANNKLVEQAAKDLGFELALQSELVPGSNNTKLAKTCYTGNPHDVVVAIAAAVDVYYSDQLNIWGYKYKNEKSNEDESVESEELETFLKEKSKTWREWRGKSDAVLVLSAVGDSGDDVQESLISRCSK